VGAGVILCGSSRLGDGSWISIAAVVKSVPVGAGAMVGPGAIVTRPVEAGAMVNGFPARATAKVNTYNEVTGR
jgi:serine acetyltransferase